MTPEALAERNASKLLEVWPPMQPKIRAILADMRGKGWHPRIQIAWRSIAAQAACRKSGASSVSFGYHNLKGADGEKEALAVDIVDDRTPYREPLLYKQHLASSAAAHGLETGIHWHDPEDPWHVQVSNPSIAQARKGLRPSWG